MDSVSKQPFAASNFSLEITNDGSPTLRLGSSQESMHHFDGAASETWFVYGRVMEVALLSVLNKQTQIFKTASIGLGLGYVELMWALIIRRHFKQENRTCFTLDSFEIVDQLRNSFQDWLNCSSPDKDSPYAQVGMQMQIVSGIKEDHFGQMKELLTRSSIFFHADLLLFTATTKWNFICFDAFSKNTDAHFWTSDYLNSFLAEHAAADCVFTTYAATSILKKALVNQNFKLIHRLGYSGKRECTLAVRGTFTDDFATFQTS